ncbi:MAG: TonB-dependent receptor plug domain-containing protein, partial [Flavobacterium sp.]
MRKFRVCCYVAFLMCSGFLSAQENIPKATTPLVTINIKQDVALDNVLIELAAKVGGRVSYQHDSLKEIPLIEWSAKSMSLLDVLEFISMQTGLTLKYQNNVITVSNDQLSTQLDDITVIAIGYGDKKKQKITTAVAEVDKRLLEGRPSSNAISTLQGSTPGLNIINNSGKSDNDVNINIRGFTSINGGSPLVLIDGVEGNLNTLNPADIENISVLKDAGAAAVYGARGAFGVVLVTTKNPEVGKVKVNINSTVNMMTPTQNTNFLTDPYLSTKLVDDSFLAATGKRYTGYNDDDYEQLRQVSLNPSLARIEIQNRNGKDQYVHYGNTDWWDYFWKDQRYSYINDVSISGGSEKVKGYFSYRNYKEDGLLKVQNDEFKKDNIRAKFDIQINDWIDFSTNNQYFKSYDLAHGGSQYGWRDPWGSLMLVHALPAYMPVNP